MIHAVKAGHHNLTAYLIKNDIGTHDKDKYGNTPLHYAVKRNAIESLPLLLDHFKLNEVNCAGETPLHVGIQAGQHQAIAFILDHGKMTHIPLEQDGIKFTPLALAVKCGQKKCVELLLTKEGLFQEVGAIGTLLHVAVKYRQPEMVEYLLYSQKVIACLKEKENSFKDLLEKKNSDGLTPLNLAASLGDLVSIQLLFEKGASLETEDLYRCRPIHQAAQCRHFETIQLLTALGAKTKVFDHEGRTPLEIVRNDATSTGRSICHYLTNALWKNKDYKVELHQLMPENFVFKGGGPKGIAYAGTIRYLAEKGILPKIKRFAGTSAGALPAVFLALACPPSKLEDILKNTSLLDYLDPPCSKDGLIDLFHTQPDSLSSAIKAAWDLLRSLRKTKEIVLHPFETLETLRKLTGICEGELFRKWAEEQIEGLTEIKYLTFGELRKLIEIDGKPYKQVTIFGTRLQDQKLKSCCAKFSSEDPKCDNYIISDCLRISLSIPGVIRPHTIHVKENNERINRPDLGDYVDGGLLNNLPIETFDYKGFQSREDLGLKGSFPVFNKRTVGFDLYSAYADIVTGKEHVKTLFELLKSIVGIYMEAEDNIRRLNPYASSRIVKINIGNVGLLDFDLTDKQKEELVNSGYLCTQDYFDKSIYQAPLNSNSATLLKAYKGYIGIPPLLPEQSFDGREELFLHLQAFCLPKKWNLKSPAPLALLSEAKINKTEVGLAFAHKHIDDFSLIKLINCESQSSLAQGYQELAEILRIYWKKESFVADINHELETGTFTDKEEAKPWLLILNNVKREVVEKLAFPKTGGAILAISEKENIWPAEEVVFEIPALLNATNIQQQTPLHRAAKGGREKNIVYLIEQGAEVNAVDGSHRTPLFIATEMGHNKAAKLLLEKKGDITITSDAEDSVLHVCAFSGNTELLALFLKQSNCKDLIDQGDYEGKTPLHKAVFRGNPRTDCVKLLCDHGANILAKNKYGYIPLHWSSMHGHLESTKIFIQKKAPLDMLNSNQESPFDLALRENQDDIIHYFLKTKKRLPKIEKKDNQSIKDFYQQQIFNAEKENLIEEQILYLIKISDLCNREKDFQGSTKAIQDAMELQRMHLKNPNLEKYLSSQLKEANQKFLNHQSAFNQLADSQLIEFGKKAPSYIYVGPGLNLRGICDNKDCDAFNKVIWIKKGVGEFDIGMDIHESKCPVCPMTVAAEKIDNFGFYDCIYSIKGLQDAPIKKEVEKNNLIANNNQLILFTESKASANWSSLKITIKSFK